MSWFTEQWRRLMFWRHREQLEQELADEMAMHRQKRAERFAQEGLDESEARDAARRRFGNISLVAEDSRSFWGWNWLDTTIQDIRYAFRQMRQSPGFTLVAALSLSLGIGATTTLFSVVHAVLMDPFPYRDVDTIMGVNVIEDGKRFGRSSYTPQEWRELAERSRVFSHVGASTITDVLWTGAGEPQRLRGSLVTPDTFSVFDVPALLGRTVEPGDGAPGATPVAVLGYKFWQRQFAGSKDVLGQRLLLNGTWRTVIGVMPKRFALRGADVYLATVFGPGANDPDVYAHFAARLKPGVTHAEAVADVTPIIADLAHREPTQFPGRWRVELESFSKTFASDLRETLLTLLGAGALLLLIACANVSNLLLARATAREREMAMRRSLGAGRGRLIRQLLTESTMLALTGGLGGVLLAWAGIQALLALVPPLFLPTESDVRLNGAVLAFTLSVSIVTALLFGLAPALSVSGGSLSEGLKTGSKGAGQPESRTRFRSALTAVEVALALMLLVGASLLVRTLLSLQQSSLTFVPEKMLTLSVPLPRERYGDPLRRAAFFQDLLPRIRSVPGVRAASLNTYLQPVGNFGAPVEVIGGSRADAQPVMLQQVDHEYLRTLGIGMRQGRMFTESEESGRRMVALANEAFVRRYLPEGNALGRVVRIPRLRQPPFRLDQDSFELIGIAQDVPNGSRRKGLQPELYMPYTLTGRADYLVVSTATPPLSVASAVRQQVYAVDPEQPVMNVRSMDAVLAESEYAKPRFTLVLFATFAGVGLALALMGVAGVMAYSVARRTREFGVRLALGAQPNELLGLVLRGGARLIALGILLGLAGSLAATGLIRNLLWGVSEWDAPTFISVALLLACAGLASCWWPARKAAKVDPIVALRYE